MRITENITYPAAPDAVYAMVSDPAFQQRKCADAGALRHEVSVTEEGPGARIVTSRDLPTDRLPDFVKSVVGATLTIVETYEWGAAQADGARDGSLVVEAAGAPVALRGKVSLRPAAGGATMTVEGDLKASIPLFGGKIEKAAAPAFVDGIRADAATAQRWLTERT